MSRGAGECGQAVIEYVVLLPLLVIAAAGLVEVGAAFGKASVLRSAADRAAVAQLQGRDELTAARAGLPASMSRTLHIYQQGDEITLRASAALPLLDVVTPIALSASARTPQPRS